MFACISPSDHYWEESLITLGYVSRASKIETYSKYQDYQPKLISELQVKAKVLQDELNAVTKYIEAFGVNKPIVEERNLENFKSDEETYSLVKMEMVETQGINPIVEPIHSNVMYFIIECHEGYLYS